MKVDKREVPSIYWKFYKLLEKHGLDDGSMSTKLAASENAKVISNKFRLNKREARKAMKEMKEYDEKKKIEKGLEQWFGKKPNGEDKNSIK